MRLWTLRERTLSLQLFSRNAVVSAQLLHRSLCSEVTFTFILFIFKDNMPLFTHLKNIVNPMMNPVGYKLEPVPTDREMCGFIQHLAGSSIHFCFALVCLKDVILLSVPQRSQGTNPECYGTGGQTAGR